MVTRVILGPQRPVRNLGTAADAAGIPDERIAVISAGWQEAEGDTAEVQALVNRPLIDLQLYQRAEELFAQDTKLGEAYRHRQDRLIELQRLYSLRLRRLMTAAREVLRARGDSELVAAEVRHAISQLRALDRHHEHRVQTLFAEFESLYSRHNNELIAAHVADIERILAQCPTVMVTGGNVVVLLNRMRLFGMQRMLEQHHLLAWSAGAMVLSERIVLFHDRTPQGRREPEVLAPGLSVLPNYIFLPDAGHRLKLNDRIRVDLFSRRFAPQECVALDSGASLIFHDNRIADADGVRRLQSGGRVARLRAA